MQEVSEEEDEGVCIRPTTGLIHSDFFVGSALVICRVRDARTAV